MEADFVQDVFVPLTERNYHSRGKMFHRSPDRFLMRFSDPQGDIVVVDGRRVWMYYPSTDPRQVTVFPLSQEGQQADLYREFLSNAGERYVATRNGAEAVAGRPAQGLTLVPRGQSPYKTVRIWVDDQDSLVRRFEITEQNGTVRKIEMTGLRPNVALADALFQFSPPAGVQVHEF
jgi:outer membrane lipoprotein carrier protein